MNWSITQGVCVCVCSAMSNSFEPHGLQPARLLCPWDSPGTITGVGSHFLLQRIFRCRDQTHIFCIGRQILYHCTIGKPSLGHTQDFLLTVNTASSPHKKEIRGENYSQRTQLPDYSTVSTPHVQKPRSLGRGLRNNSRKNSFIAQKRIVQM